MRGPESVTTIDVQALLASLTLAEKASLMSNANAPVPRLGLAGYDHWTEALHGLSAGARAATVYPIPLALAAGFDTELVETIGRQIAIEGQAAHAQALLEHPTGTGMSEGLTFFAPNMNILRDPRWGRGQETFGECPQLSARMGVAMVRGLQFENRACAVAKHFAVHSGPEHSRFTFNAVASAYDLADTYLPAFRATVVEGGVAGLMTAYNALNGTPGAAHAGLMQDVARGLWGFAGFTLCDCNAVRFMHTHHATVGSEAQAVAAAVRAGMDMELYAGPKPAAGAYLEAVEQGLLREAELDLAISRTLAARARLAAAKTSAQPDLQAHSRTALQAARQGIVLLKNEAGLLPLSNSVRHIAVVGPLADDTETLLGNYHGEPTQGLSPLQALRLQFPNVEFTHARGANVPITPVDIPKAWLFTEADEPGLNVERFPGFGPGGEPVARWVEEQALWFGRAGQGCTRWTGWLQVPAGGEWLIGSHGTGASRLWLDEVLQADDSRPHAPSDCLARVQLQAGQRVRLRFEVMGMPMGFSRLVAYRHEPDALNAALQAVAQADLVLAFVGLNGRLEGEDLPVDLPGFKGGDRETLGLPDEQAALMAAIAQTGKPCVTVLMGGGALAVESDTTTPSAVLHAWYGGQEAGTAIAEILSGAVNPSGRLPVTVYRNAAQLPAFDDYAMAGRTYRYFTGVPLYAFGHGLSYTRFNYDSAQLSVTQLAAGDELVVEASISNTGLRDGDEVVQVYVECAGAEIKANASLRAFQRVHIPAGQTRRVQLTLNPRQLSAVRADGSRWVFEGPHTLHIGGGQPGTAAPSVALPFVVAGCLQLLD
jgi:beta-glucosidase